MFLQTAVINTHASTPEIARSFKQILSHYFNISCIILKMNIAFICGIEVSNAIIALYFY